MQGTFKNSSHGGGACVPCSSECPIIIDHFISARCTATADIVCTRCRSSCGLGDFFMSEPCGIETDAVCRRCRSSCPPTFFVSGACTAMADAPCAACTAACRNDSFSIAPCGGASDLVCEPCPEATFTDDGGACRACDAGTIFVVNGGCVRCPFATYSNAQRTACVTHCPPGPPLSL